MKKTFIIATCLLTLSVVGAEVTRESGTDSKQAARTEVAEYAHAETMFGDSTALDLRQIWGLGVVASRSQMPDKPAPPAQVAPHTAAPAIPLFIGSQAGYDPIGNARVEDKDETRAWFNRPSVWKSELSPTPLNNIGVSLEHPGLVCSGVLVQVLKISNPFQLINPFAPAEYGASEANTAFDLISGRATGLKLFSIRF
jgi:hypothetical protein